MKAALQEISIIPSTCITLVNPSVHPLLMVSSNIIQECVVPLYDTLDKITKRGYIEFVYRCHMSFRAYKLFCLMYDLTCILNDILCYDAVLSLFTELASWCSTFIFKLEVLSCNYINSEVLLMMWTLSLYTNRQGNTGDTIGIDRH